MRETRQTLVDLVPLDCREIGAVWAATYGHARTDSDIERQWARERAERPTLRLTPLDYLPSRLLAG